MFSLKLLDTESQSNAGAKMHVTNPQTLMPAYLDADTKEPVQAVTISFLGANSDEAKAFELKEARVNIKKNSGKRKTKEVELPDTLFEDSAEATAKRLTALATGWDNMPDDEGGLIPFSKEKALELFAKIKGLRDQAKEFIDDDVNFMQG